MEECDRMKGYGKSSCQRDMMDKLDIFMAISMEILGHPCPKGADHANH